MVLCCYTRSFALTSPLYWNVSDKDLTILVNARSYPWGHIIIDEGHRLKDASCKLATELSLYQSKSRLLLTGETRLVVVCTFMRV